MMKPVIPGSENKISHELSARSESLQKISEILKRTNELIRKGDLERAQGELTVANREAKEKIRSIIITSSKENASRTQNALPPLPLAPIEALINTISSPKQKANSSTWNSSVPANPSEKRPQVQSDQSDSRMIEFNYYKEALAKAWCDGSLTEDEKRQLMELRSVLEISDQEHEIFEKEVRDECYQIAVMQFRAKGSTTLLNAKSLEDIQKAFNIEPEEARQTANQLMCEKSTDTQDRIIIIDDDVKFLELLNTSMTEEGFKVTALATSDEAYTLLQEYTPDLILCDINLTTSTMDGFTFYERLQKNKRIQKVPFVFLTGLSDEKLAITGKELGADDYLTKPIPRTTLITTLRGRIRRFKQLHGYYEAHPSASF
jgi:CheY-like chemotaxis protein